MSVTFTHYIRNVTQPARNPSQFPAARTGRNNTKLIFLMDQSTPFAASPRRVVVIFEATFLPHVPTRKYFIAVDVGCLISELLGIAANSERVKGPEQRFVVLRANATWYVTHIARRSKKLAVFWWRHRFLEFSGE